MWDPLDICRGQMSTLVYHLWGFCPFMPIFIGGKCPGEGLCPTLEKPAAPAPHGPGLDKQDLSVNARTVPLGKSCASFLPPMYLTVPAPWVEILIGQEYSKIVIIRCPSWYSGSVWTINTFVPVSLVISSAWLLSFPIGGACLPWPVSNSRQPFKSFLTGSSFLFAAIFPMSLMAISVNHTGQVG